jgi:hypothetical protein
MDQVALPQLERIEPTAFGTVGFSSTAFFDPSTSSTITNAIKNSTTEVGFFQWAGVGDYTVKPGDLRGPMVSRVSIKGLLGSLHKPSQTRSDVTLNTVGGLVTIHKVPRYVERMDRITRIPRALGKVAVSLVFKHLIPGASPGVVVTAEVSEIVGDDQPTMQYRVTAAAEGEDEYSLAWNGLQPVLIAPGFPVVLEEFTHSGVIDLVEASVELLSRDNWRAWATVSVPRPSESETLEYEGAASEVARAEFESAGGEIAKWPTADST